ncbi:hypothetical protein [Riemerella columbina]|uniref:hypothetical protein n=1 Tax=Riemerella columbina TaxID=103810 RepID=UPI000373CAB6|nr:hypothetical protein [Riemerella columbina]
MKLKWCYYLFILLLYLGCTSVAPLPYQFQKKWMLVEFQGYKKQDLMAHQAYLNMSPTMTNPHQYFISIDGKKHYFRIEFLNGKKVSIIPLGIPKSANSKLEQQWVELLPTLNRYKIKGHFLTLYHPNGKTIKLVAEDWD